MAPAAHPSTFTTRLRDDARHAVEHTLFTLVAGSPFLPRVFRRLVLALAGAHLGSSPGPLFSLTGDPRNLSVGTNVYCNRNVTIEAVAPVRIGSHSAIGMQVLVMTSHHEIGADGGWSPEASGRPVTIGERVWIGGRATILPGTVIEDDVVIAAGAVARGRLTSHGVYAGVPARRIRELAPGSAPAGAASRAAADTQTPPAPVVRPDDSRVR
jgi:maltose O-acetyltransferase